MIEVYKFLHNVTHSAGETCRGPHKGAQSQAEQDELPPGSQEEFLQHVCGKQLEQLTRRYCKSPQPEHIQGQTGPPLEQISIYSQLSQA